MTRLAEILDQMSAVLNDLKTVMDQEQQHLYGADQRQPVAMDYRTKSSLLATLDYLEQLRRKEPMQQIALILVNAGRKLL